jgi:site-specific DNA-methyltransferase (adenine-specific)
MVKKEHMKILHSSKSMEWETPDYIFNKLNKEFNFTLDPCATKDNAKCDKYYTMEDDGLTKDWSGEIVFINPPYGMYDCRTSLVELWIKKAYEASQDGTIIVCLIPARTDTLYWHNYIFPYAAQIRFIKRRIKFRRDGVLDSAPFPSAVIVFNQELWQYRVPENSLHHIKQCVSTEFKLGV